MHTCALLPREKPFFVFGTLYSDAVEISKRFQIFMVFIEQSIQAKWPEDLWTREEEGEYKRKAFELFNASERLEWKIYV